MRENRLSGSEGGGSKLNCFSLPLFEPLFSVVSVPSVSPCLAFGRFLRHLRVLQTMVVGVATLTI